MGLPFVAQTSTSHLRSSDRKNMAVRSMFGLLVLLPMCSSVALFPFSTVLHKLYRKIVERDLTFSEQAWKQVSKGGIDFVLRMLQVRPGDRPTSEMSLTHPWLRRCGPMENSSSMSFHDGNTSWCDSNANYYNDYCYGDPVRSTSSNGVRWPSAQSAVPSSLQHAHKVSGEGNQRCIDSQMRGETPPRNHGQTQRNTPIVS